ncbi:MAG: xanthine dehydrogenase family protein molybdopterin-binding subunit [Bacteroidetes bacterium]|nr:xanthine dehydrogenase family protein molybdopterin-binding subunit [Bacteroidota bacterium]
MKKEFTVVGKPVIRQDGIEKVTGKSKFADDLVFPDMLFGVMIRTDHTHAIVKSVDYSKLDTNKFVIVNADDIPGSKKVGAIVKDQPVFCNEKIVTPGDVVAMLVGEDLNELRKAAKSVKVNCEELPVLSDPLKALDENAMLIHPELGSNKIVHYPLRKGDVDKGFGESEYILEEEYSTPLIEHAYIEPECVTAFIEPNGGIKIIGSIQNLHTTRRVVASVLNYPLAKVRVVQAELGGSFGGKDDTMNILSARAAVAALKTGSPVKIKYGREESILESYKRHPYFMKYKVGFNSDGKIKAMKIDITADGGAYASLSPYVTWRSVVQATGPYEIENVHTDVTAVYTNNPYTGAMRGFGSPQPIFAQESIMDEIAIRLNKTPVEIRKINGFKSGSFTASGHKLRDHDVNLFSVLERASDESDFEAKWNENQNGKSFDLFKRFAEKSIFSSEELLVKDDEFCDENIWKNGIGLALSFRGCSLGAEGIDAAAAYFSLQTDGSAYLLSGLAENGQGLRTTFSIIAAEELGISVNDIYYLEQDTGIIADSGPTVASRSTLMGGGAVKNAAEQVRKRLEIIFREKFNLDEKEEIKFANHVVSDYLGKVKIPFKKLVMLASSKGVGLSSVGWYKGPDVYWEEKTGQGEAYFTYAYGCQVAEIKVNIITGEVYIDKITAVHDAGKIINLLGAEGQVYGGVTQGAGYGLWETVDKVEGKIRDLNFDQYLIPTCKDVGDIKPIFIEGEEKYGPWGAKSLGEPTLELGAAAIANAVRNAVGQRHRNLPINLEELILSRKLSPEDLKRGSAV